MDIVRVGKGESRAWQEYNSWRCCSGEEKYWTSKSTNSGSQAGFSGSTGIVDTGGRLVVVVVIVIVVVAVTVTGLVT